MKILVTGGAGFIGSYVVERLVAGGHQVTVLDNLDPQVHGGAGHPRNLDGVLADVRFVRGDVTDRGACQPLVDDCDAIVHLAATVGVGQSMYEPHYYVHTNAGGTGLLLDLVARRRAPLARLVVASSMSLYGEGRYRCPACGSGEVGERTRARLEGRRWEVPCARCGADLTPLPTDERKTPEIASVYAATKKHQEDLAIAFGRAWHIPTFALRFFNVYGARQSLGNPYTGVAAIFLSRLLNGRPPVVFEDGLQTRDLIDVRDVAEAVVLAVDSPHTDAHVLNVATGRRSSVLEVAETLARELGVDLPPQVTSRFRAGDIRHCFGDPALACEVLGFQATRRFEDGVGALIEWCRRERRPEDRVEDSLRELTERNLVQ